MDVDVDVDEARLSLLRVCLAPRSGSEAASVRPSSALCPPLTHAPLPPSRTSLSHSSPTPLPLLSLSFVEADVETRITVLASLTSVPPGVRRDENHFVKLSFANLCRPPAVR